MTDEEANWPLGYGGAKFTKSQIERFGDLASLYLHNLKKAQGVDTTLERLYDKPAVVQPEGDMETTASGIQEVSDAVHADLAAGQMSVQSYKDQVRENLRAARAAAQQRGQTANRRPPFSRE